MKLKAGKTYKELDHNNEFFYVFKVLSREGQVAKVLIIDNYSENAMYEKNKIYNWDLKSTEQKTNKVFLDLEAEFNEWLFTNPIDI